MGRPQPKGQRAKRARLGAKASVGVLHSAPGSKPVSSSPFALCADDGSYCVNNARDFYIGKLCRKRQAHRLATDAHCVWVILRSPAKSVLINRMLGNTKVVNAHADFVPGHFGEKFVSGKAATRFVNQ